MMQFFLLLAGLLAAIASEATPRPGLAFFFSVVLLLTLTAMLLSDGLT